MNFHVDEHVDVHLHVHKHVHAHPHVGADVDIHIHVHLDRDRGEEGAGFPTTFLLGLIFLRLQMTWIKSELYHLKVTKRIYSCICAS